MATDDKFSEAVYAYLDEDRTRALAMATHFEAAVTTVRRWSEGTARPHPRMQRQILRYIADQAMGDEGDIGGEG